MHIVTTTDMHQPAADVEGLANWTEKDAII